MTERRALASGDVLAGRYELADLVSEKLGATTWRAHDSVLRRNVGIELLPSDDPRADHFLEAARMSTTVTDPRFLRVLDLIPDDRGHHLVVREWARAFTLDALLAESPLPNRRAATVVAEVAEALSHAHTLGLHHRRLTPHQVLLKQSGAVRIVGLGVATALAPVGRPDSFTDLKEHERLDVQSLGKLLYSCLVSRWPGGHVDGLRAAPTEHGRLLRPRQVRAGVSRDVDTICDRILGDPPQHHLTQLTTAAEIAHALRGVGTDPVHAEPVKAHDTSPDLLRLDPVVVPAGPPPGLEPPRRRPKAYEPPPPTPLERGKERALRATRGDRGLVLLGVIGTLLIGGVLALLVNFTRGDTPAPDRGPNGASAVLQIREAIDLDPQGDDGTENPELTPLAIDGDPETGWRTTTYLGNPALGGLKDGVGLVLDLGGPREVESLRIQLDGQPTDVTIYASAASADGPPRSVRGLLRVAVLDATGTDATVSLQGGILTRYVVVWLTRLPEIGEGRYRGEIREITIRGSLGR